MELYNENWGEEEREKTEVELLEEDFAEFAQQVEELCSFYNTIKERVFNLTEREEKLLYSNDLKWALEAVRAIK
ncbi:MAG: hypothetical protein AB7P94_17255 [Steroidobacteraceae bacterium]